MQIAIQHPKPGVSGPRGVLIALAVIGVMGFYGFTTALQKSISDRRTSIVAVRGDDTVRPASAVAPTPSMIYAVSDTPPPSARPVQRSPPKPAEPAEPAEPVISPEPTPVHLTPVTPTQVAVAPVIQAPNASAIGVTASVIEPSAPASAPPP